MNKILKSVSFLLVVSVFLFGCASTKQEEVVVEEPEETEETTPEPTPEEVTPVEHKELGAIIESSEEIQNNINSMNENDYLETLEYLEDLANAYQDFSVTLLRNAIKKGDNFVISPLSAYYALALLSNAAASETKEKLEKTLGVDNQTLNRYLYTYLKNTTRDYEGFVPSIVMGNSVWLNKDFNYVLNENYREIVQNYYQSDVFTESFSDANTIPTMNKWVEEHTRDMIHDLFSDTNVTPATTFVLCNALSYDSKWIIPFESSENTLEKFHNYDGSEVNTTMMHRTERGHWSDGQAEGIDLGTVGGQSFVVILPNEGVDVYEYIEQMSNDTFSKFYENIKTVGNETETSIEYYYTNLHIPKFKYETTIEMDDSLKAMGLENIYENNADFSRMLSEEYERLFVDTVIQKAVIDVNEEGVSAAAATMIGGLGAEGPEKEIIDVYYELDLDRPFIYAIVDDGIPIFMGVSTTYENETEVTVGNQ